MKQFVRNKGLPEGLIRYCNTEVFVFAGERSGHAGSDGVAPRSAGRPPSDLQAVARIRGGRLAGVTAGLHCSSNGK